MVAIYSVPMSTESGGGDPAIKGALKDAQLLNKTTPTIANAWDLVSSENAPLSGVDRPPQNVRLRMMRQNQYENILGVDRRTKVDPKDFAPGGRFRGVCKLFMYFQHSSDPYVGTGWLIQNDLIVTAGHCAHDLSDGLGYVSTIKAYMGFNGPNSDKDPNVQMRYGKYAVVPSEWVRSAAPTYDVAFIRLSKAFDNVEPIKYTDTPVQGNDYLGVVGYPNDKEGGNYMYQAFTQVAYNLENSQRNSGSPVLRGDDSRSIGVHCYGGALNSASVIGPAGNIFADYITALSIKEKGQSGQMYITIPAREKSVNLGDAISGPQSGMEVGRLNGVTKFDPVASSESAEDQLMSALAAWLLEKQRHQLPNGIIPLPSPGPINGAPKPFLILPDRIIALPESDPLNTPPVDNIKNGIPPDQQDLPSVQFIDFPKAALEGTDLEAQRALQKNIGLYRADLTTRVEQQVLSKVNDKSLDSNNLIAMASYRAKCHDAFMRYRSSWFEAGSSQTKRQTINVKKAEFHTEILKAVLEGFMIPVTVYSQLEKVLTSIGDGVLKVGMTNKSQSIIFWTEMVRYDWNPVTRDSSASIQTIYFQSTENTTSYMIGKNSYDTVNFDLQFAQYRATFNNDIFGQIADESLKASVEKGKNLMKEPLVVDL